MCDKCHNRYRLLFEPMINTYRILEDDKPLNFLFFNEQMATDFMDELRREESDATHYEERDQAKGEKYWDDMQKDRGY